MNKEKLSKGCESARNYIIQLFLENMYENPLKLQN